MREPVVLLLQHIIGQHILCVLEEVFPSVLANTTIVYNLRKMHYGRWRSRITVSDPNVPFKM